MKKLTFKQIRDLFFEVCSQFEKERKYRKRHNDYSDDCRMCFCDFIDSLSRDGIITESQNKNITL